MYYDVTITLKYNLMAKCELMDFNACKGQEPFYAKI